MGQVRNIIAILKCIFSRNNLDLVDKFIRQLFYCFEFLNNGVMGQSCSQATFQRLLRRHRYHGMVFFRVFLAEHLFPGAYLSGISHQELQSFDTESVSSELSGDDGDTNGEAANVAPSNPDQVRV